MAKQLMFKFRPLYFQADIRPSWLHGGRNVSSYSKNRCTGYNRKPRIHLELTSAERIDSRIYYLTSLAPSNVRKRWKNSGATLKRKDIGRMNASIINCRIEYRASKNQII